MSKLPNPSRGEVAFREAGENAHLLYSIDAMERFYGELGDDYQTRVVLQIGNASPPAFLRTAFETMLVDGSPDGFPFGLTVKEITTRLLDAISLGINGKDFATFQKEAEEEEKERKKKLAEEIAANPALVLLDQEVLKSLYLREAKLDSLSSKSDEAVSSISSGSGIES